MGLALVAGLTLALGACGGGDSSAPFSTPPVPPTTPAPAPVAPPTDPTPVVPPTGPAASYTVGGTVTGLLSSALVIQNNGTNDLILSTNGAFTFAQPITSGPSYAVSIKTPPAFEKCTVTNGSGAATANITNVMITCTPFQVMTLAGNGTPGAVDGNGATASFSSPTGIASDPAGNLYVSEWQSGKLRMISPAGEVSTLTTSIKNVIGIAVSPSGEVYVASTGMYTIWKAMSPMGPFMPFAGSGSNSSKDGNGTAALFNNANGLALDRAGNLYVTELDGRRIRKVSPNGDVTTLAGNGSADNNDGTGTAASFMGPSGIAVGPDGNLYVSDMADTIRKVTPAGVVTTWAGSGSRGSTDGTGRAASFNQPYGIAVDASGTAYVTEAGGHRIRQIDPNGVVTTLAGTGVSGSQDGAANTATFNNPTAILVDAHSDLVIVEQMGHRIRKLIRQ